MTTILLLTISDIFMTIAWYGHLKYRQSPRLAHPPKEPLPQGCLSDISGPEFSAIVGVFLGIFDNYFAKCPEHDGQRGILFPRMSWSRRRVPSGRPESKQLIA